MNIERLERELNAATEKLRKAVVKKFPIGTRVRVPHGHWGQICIVRGHSSWGDIGVYLVNERTGTHLSRGYESLSFA